jgi:hypothetical protein
MPSRMCARVALLRVTGAAVGLVTGATDGITAGADLVAAFVFCTEFTVTLARFELFVAFLDRLGFFILCPLHGTREPYACLERIKVLIKGVSHSTEFKITEVGNRQAVEQGLRCVTGRKPRRSTTRG